MASTVVATTCAMRPPPVLALAPPPAGINADSDTVRSGGESLSFVVDVGHYDVYVQFYADRLNARNMPWLRLMEDVEVTLD